jgi:hypothetical protein
MLPSTITVIESFLLDKDNNFLSMLPYQQHSELQLYLGDAKSMRGVIAIGWHH